ncbi:hypothetical protein B0T14DRAFT_558 [Immersiella caudata]|uniref:Transmembrane protein n=1 Tax=Immersiella caudata TaxID=314043 RepID=A0AA40CBH7_9PEZI|nr:hypothetical protein B0T14DRAFT_558 [Immersiella caudata]
MCELPNFEASCCAPSRRALFPISPNCTFIALLSHMFPPRQPRETRHPATVVRLIDRVRSSTQVWKMGPWWSVPQYTAMAGFTERRASRYLSTVHPTVRYLAGTRPPHSNNVRQWHPQSIGSQSQLRFARCDGFHATCDGTDLSLMKSRSQPRFGVLLICVFVRTGSCLHFRLFLIAHTRTGGNHSMQLPPASRPRFAAREDTDSDAKPPPTADHPMSTTPLSSPDSTAIQTLAFGLFTALLAMIAVFISYRQLRIMLRRRRGRSATARHGHTQAEAELVQLRDLVHSTPRHNQPFLKTPQLLAQVYTFQQVTVHPWTPQRQKPTSNAE